MTLWRNAAIVAIECISMNPVSSNRREEDSPDSSALTQSRKERCRREVKRHPVQGRERKAREGEMEWREREVDKKKKTHTQGAEQSFCVNGGDHGCQ